MKTIFVALDAKYIHTNLAIRSVKSYIQSKSDLDILLSEHTINQPKRQILQDLYLHQGNVYIFSCYLWNIALVRELTCELKTILPKTMIFLAGPEATYQVQSLLEQLPIQGVLLGEGEVTTLSLLTHLQTGQSIEAVSGLFLPTGKTPPATPMDMDELVFAYEDLDTLNHRVLYYESMRGCPFSCSYCLSSVEQGVRTRSFQKVCEDLDIFLANKVPQVKFVDRTFNCKPEHALQIWSYLIQHDNEITNFHFELAGELISPEMSMLLEQARPGLFQFEVGVQSTNPKTLAAIHRPLSFEKLKQALSPIFAQNRIHLHLDLIAGLPFENFNQFQQSFCDVYSLRPHQFQLGFLKVLAGSDMEQHTQEYGLSYEPTPPYEVLQTNWLSFEELRILKGVEEMVEIYYNSGRFSHLIQELEEDYSTDAFSFYLSLWKVYDQKVGNNPISKIGYYEVLYNWITAYNLEGNLTYPWLCRYDLLLHELPKKMPKWVMVEGVQQYREEIKLFYHNPANIAKYLPAYQGKDPKYISRVTHLEFFPFDPSTKKQSITPILFDYQQRTVLGHAIEYRLLQEDFCPVL